jgi:hypothetical protein
MARILFIRQNDNTFFILPNDSILQKDDSDLSGKGLTLSSQEYKQEYLFFTQNMAAFHISITTL